MLKGKKQKIENFFLKRIAFNISPNYITFFSIVLMLLCSYFITIKSFYIAGILFLVSGVMDAYDGFIARKFNRATSFGAFFDRTTDRINDAIPVLSITMVGLVNLKLGIIVLFLTIFCSYVSATIEVLSKTRVGEVISTRHIRTTILFLGIILQQFSIAFWVLLVLGIYAVMYRYYRAGKILRY